MIVRKTQLATSVAYACLLIGQQWRIDHAELYALPGDPQRQREARAKGVTTGRTPSTPEHQTANTPKPGQDALKDALQDVDYTSLEVRAIAAQEGA